MFRLIFERITNLLELGFIQVVVYSLVVVPFLLMVGFAYVVFLSEHDINYYLAFTPPEFWIAATLAAVLAVGLLTCLAVLYVKWSLSLPCLLFGSRRGLLALRESGGLVRGAFSQVAGLVLGWPLVLSLLAGCVAFAVHGIGEYLLRGSGGSLQFIIAVVAVVLTLDFLTSAALSQSQAERIISYAANARSISQLDIFYDYLFGLGIAVTRSELGDWRSTRGALVHAAGRS